MLTTLLIILAGIQMLLVAVITRRYKSIFDKHKAHSYFVAVSELCRVNPLAGYTVRACYAALLVEALLLIFTK